MTGRPSKPLRAAIVGGGIGGLAAAIALSRRDIEVTVYEQAPALSEIGAGLVLYPNSLRQLDRLGVGQAVMARGARLGPNSQYCRRDGSVVSSVLATDRTGVDGVHGMHRADLLEVLAGALSPKQIRTGHRCIAFDQTLESATLTFANGERAEVDVALAADGIQSVLQKYVVPPAPPEYSGVRAYRGVVRRDRLSDWRDEAHQVWMGDGKHFMVYPVRAGELLNYVGFVPTQTQTPESWSAVGDRDELAASFEGWNTSVTEVLKHVESCFWWGLYDRRPLPSWSNGRLALLGDAAHAMLPHLGQGANQAIEDGVALAVLLEGCRSDDVADALKRYQALRRPRTDRIQAEARQNGLRYDSRYANLEVRDREVASGAAFRQWVYDYDIEKEALAARDGSERGSG